MNVSGALQLLISFAIDFYIVIIITRFMLQMVRADFYNPLSQFVVKATSPILNPLRRIIPGYGGWDVASVVLLLIVVLIKVGLVLAVNGIGGVDGDGRGRNRGDRTLQPVDPSGRHIGHIDRVAGFQV